MGPRTVSLFAVWFPSGGAALKDISYPPRAQTKTGPAEELRTLEKKFTEQNHRTQPHDPKRPQRGFVYSFILTRLGQKSHTDGPWASRAAQRWLD